MSSIVSASTRAMAPAVQIPEPAANTHEQPGRSPGPPHHRPPMPLLRPSTLPHQVASQLEFTPGFSARTLAAAVQDAANRESWVQALERAVQGKVDDEAIDLGSIRFSISPGSTLFTETQRGRKALMVLAARPGLRAMLRQHAIIDPTPRLMLKDGRLTVLDGAGRWLDLTQQVSVKPGLKRRLEALVKMAEGTGRILHSTGAVDGAQALRMGWAGRAGSTAVANAGEVRNLINWQRHPLPSSPPMGNYAGSLLAARIDPELGEHRNHIAGYDLYSTQNAGLKLRVVRDDLQTHLIRSRGVKPEEAESAAHVMLARVAPEFLVRDIPDTLHIGSPAWLAFRATVAILEEVAPGSSRTLTYSQVLQRSSLQPLTAAQTLLFHAAETDPLLDWGVLNGVIAARDDDDYGLEDLKKCVRKYNDYVAATVNVTAILATPIKTRRDLALTDLRAVFAEQKLDDPVHQVSFHLPFFLPDVGYEQSLLELHMMGSLKTGEFRSKELDGPFGRHIATFTFKGGPDAGNQEEGFKQLKLSSHDLERTVKRSTDAFADAVSTRIKDILGKMPYADRHLLETQELTFYRVEGQSINGAGEAANSAEAQTKAVQGRYGFLVTAGTGAQAKCFEFVPLSGEYYERPEFLTRLADAEAIVPRLWVAKLKSHVDGKGLGNSEVQIRALRETLPATRLTGKQGLVPTGYFSPRAKDFADYVSRHNLVLDREQLQAAAMGETPREHFESRLKLAVKTVEDIVIPFKGCYDDIASGHVKKDLGALTGCALDVLVLVSVAGGATVEGIEAVGRAETALSKVSAAVRAVGTATNSLLNPVAGLGKPLEQAYTRLKKGAFLRLGRPVAEARALWKAGLGERPRQMRRASIESGELPTRVPIPLPEAKTTQAPTATSPLEQSRQAIERSLPIARQRLDGALSTLSDPQYEKDLKFVCNTFYGSDSEETLQAFTRKQRAMKVDLDKLKLENINFLEGEGKDWQAQLYPSSYARYKAGNLQEKYIEVNVDGAIEYYRYMGRSDDAMANTLIHEQAHGFPGDEDYVYSGAIKGGHEDIADLLNLGKTTDPMHFRHPSEEMQEATLSLFAKTPQAHNADSTLFGIALLDQAKNNRALYEENVAAIQQALAKAKAEGGLITDLLPVRIIRKRAAPNVSFPRFMLMRHDQTGEIVQVLERFPRPQTRRRNAPRAVTDIVQDVFKWR